MRDFELVTLVHGRKTKGGVGGPDMFTFTDWDFLSLVFFHTFPKAGRLEDKSTFVKTSVWSPDILGWS